jgi:uncharacterized membrane protein
MRRRLAILWLAIAASLALAAPALGRSSDVTDANVELRLAPSGALLVTEQLTFTYDGHFEGSYRDINVVGGARISDVTLSQGGQRFQPGGNTALGSAGPPGVFGVEQDNGFYRVVWHYRATDEQRTYDLSYRVTSAAIAYDDVVDVGWTVWGDQWDFDLNHLSASLANPALDPANNAYRVWGSPRSVEGTTVRGDGEATLQATNVRSGTAVDFRVTVPRDPANAYPQARQASGDGLPSILAEEQAETDDYNSFFNRLKRFIEDNWLALMLAIAVLAGLFNLLLIWLAREHTTSVPEYLPEPPDDATPALAYGLAHEGVDSDDTVLATLLDLVDRGYYETSEATSGDEKLDLALQQKADRPAGELTDYEQDVLAFFDQLLDGNKVALGEMKDKIPQHSELWRGRWERMTAKLYAADEGQFAWDRNLAVPRYIVMALVLVLDVIIAIVHSADHGSLIPPGIIGAATLFGLMSIADQRYRRLDAKHVERTARWQAFERWTEDFPRLSDDPPATLELWKRILVFGVAFGTADRMIKSGRIPAPVVASATASTGLWSAYAFSGGFNSAAFDGSTFSSSFASQVAPQSSSSGGGGGFSGGGGGGFSGGGGGGSW